MQSQFVHPQFAVVDLKSIRLMKDKSETYLSLINFIKSKKPFSQRYLEKAFDLLDAVAPGGYFRLDAEEVLLDLVPTPNHDWEGFAETMVILASSKNMDQLSSVLSFLTSIVSSLDAQEHIRLLENGFIPRLVTAVNPQTLPLSGHPNHENFISHLNESLNLVYQFWSSSDEIIQLLLDHVLHPCTEYFGFLCRNAINLGNTECGSSLLNQITFMLPYTQNNPELFQFVDIVSGYKAIVTLLDLFDFQRPIYECLTTISYISLENPSQSQRISSTHNIIVDVLREYGLEDKLDQLHHFTLKVSDGKKIRGKTTEILEYMGENSVKIQVNYFRR